MWPFTRKPKEPQLATNEQVMKALTSQAAAIALLQERLEALQSAHERLRGRVYATGLHKAPETQAEPEAPHNGRKPTLLELGFQPGRPFPHK